MSSDKPISINFAPPDLGFQHFVFFNRLATAQVDGVIIYLGFSPDNNDPKRWFAFYFSRLTIKQFQDSSKAYFNEVGMPKDLTPLPSAPYYIDCPIIPVDTILLSRLEGNCQISLYVYNYHPVVNKIRAKKQQADNAPIALCPIAILRSPDEEHKRFISFLMGAQP